MSVLGPQDLIKCPSVSVPLPSLLSYFPSDEMVAGFLVLFEKHVKCQGQSMLFHPKVKI